MLSCASPQRPEAPAVAGTSEAIVYGDDDRREWFELDDSVLRASAAASVVALIPQNELEVDSEAVSIAADSWGEAGNLCSSERFVEQPAAALCSGVLVDWDLVLTASHCARVVALDQLAVVFGYYYRAPAQLALTARDVYHPQVIVAEALGATGAAPRLDYAFIKLDRAVAAPRAPAPLRLRALDQDQALALIGASGGVPLKIDTAGEARDPRPDSHDYFVADTDSARGASGGPAFDAMGAVAGVLARGGPDLFETDQGCNATLVRADASGAEEQFSYIAPALDALCRQAPEASSLCRKDCGETCSALPRPARAAASCAVIRVGALSHCASDLALWLTLLAFTCGALRTRCLARHAGPGPCLLTQDGVRRADRGDTGKPCSTPRRRSEIPGARCLASSPCA
jgi:hypothetical protein